MDYIKDIDKLTGSTSTFVPCKHRGWWFEIQFLFWHKKFLWCDRCKKAIPEKIVMKNAEILHRRSDGFFMTSQD